MYIIVTLDKLVFHKNIQYFSNLAERLITTSILCLLISRGDCEGKLGTLNTFKTRNFDSFPGFLDKPRGETAARSTRMGLSA